VAGLLEFYIADTRTINVDRIIWTNREFWQSRLSNWRDFQSDAAGHSHQHPLKWTTKMIFWGALARA
jgi:hypothetical protein